MDEAIRHLVERIHAAHTMAVIVVTGAGSQAVAWLLGVPGASRTVLEALIPYSRRSLIGFLGHEPEQYVSAETARALAAQAYRRALALREEDVPVVGLGCTATIITDRPKRGEHRAHIAAQTAAGTTTYSLTLTKGLRDREGEEGVVSRLVLRALAAACGLEAPIDLQLRPSDALETAHHDPIQRLLLGEVRTVTVYPDGRLVEDEPLPTGVGILPGSFNPLHIGHVGLAQVAGAMLGAEVLFEISVRNVDKQPLCEEDIRRRLAQFAQEQPSPPSPGAPGEGDTGVRVFPARVVLTDAPLIAQKAQLFPGCTFVIGYDTAARLLNPVYYEGEEEGVRRALATIRAAGCRLLVAGRLVEGAYHTLADLDIPAEFADLFQAIPEAAFRMDISSSEIRAATADERRKTEDRGEGTSEDMGAAP